MQTASSLSAQSKPSRAGERRWHTPPRWIWCHCCCACLDITLYDEPRAACDAACPRLHHNELWWTMTHSTLAADETHRAMRPVVSQKCAYRALGCRKLTTQQCGQFHGVESRRDSPRRHVVRVRSYGRANPVFLSCTGTYCAVDAAARAGPCTPVFAHHARQRGIWPEDGPFVLDAVVLDRC